MAPPPAEKKTFGMGLGLAKKPEEKKPEEKKPDGKPRGPPKKYVNVNWSIISHVFIDKEYNLPGLLDFHIYTFSRIWITVAMLN